MNRVTKDATAAHDASLDTSGGRPADAIAAPASDRLVDLIATRRSVSPKRVVAPGPSMQEIADFVRLAMTAPDHCALRPWRFVLVPEADRSALGALFAEEKRLHEPDAGIMDFEKERQRAFNGPTLLAVILRRIEDHARVPVSEQLISLGAAMQNLLLAAHARGYAGMITSGRKIRSPVIQQAFCPSPAETLVGFITLGTPREAASARAPAVLSDHFSVWQPGGSADR